MLFLCILCAKATSGAFRISCSLYILYLYKAAESSCRQQCGENTFFCDVLHSLKVSEEGFSQVENSHTLSFSILISDIKIVLQGKVDYYLSHTNCSFHFSFGCLWFSVVTLNEGLEAVNEDTGVIKDWREKFSILKTGFDAADNKIEQGKEAQSAEQIESCYQMLKVDMGFFDTIVCFRYKRLFSLRMRLMIERIDVCFVHRQR